MIVSYGAWHLFKTEKLDLSQDFLGCFRRDQNGEVVNAASRLMSQDTYQMEDMKIPRPKVRYFNPYYSLISSHPFIKFLAYCLMSKLFSCFRLNISGTVTGRRELTKTRDLTELESVPGLMPVWSVAFHMCHTTTPHCNYLCILYV